MQCGDRWTRQIENKAQSGVNMAHTMQSLIYLKYDHLQVLEIDINFVDILWSVAIVEHDK